MQTGVTRVVPPRLAAQVTSAWGGYQGSEEAPAVEWNVPEGSLGSATHELCDLRKVTFPFWASDVRFNEGFPNRGPWWNELGRCFLWGHLLGLWHKYIKGSVWLCHQGTWSLVGAFWETLARISAEVPSISVLL